MIESSLSLEQPWFLTANVEACVLKYLEEKEHYDILSSGHPAALGLGVEIVAAGGSGAEQTHRLISVIGWPATDLGAGDAWYAVQDRPEVAARTWLANALLELSLERGADPKVGLGLALPAIASYIRYLQRLRWLLSSACITVYLVSQEGQVTLTEPECAPTAHAEQTGSARQKPGLPGASRLRLPLLHALVAAGGAASRGDVIAAVARLFAQVPDPASAQFGQRLSIAQNQLQADGLTELQGRGVWAITDLGRAHYNAEWSSWSNSQVAANQNVLAGAADADEG